MSDFSPSDSCRPVPLAGRLSALVIALLVSLAGCGSGDVDSEGEHGKHVDPPHKPAHFAAAVRDVDRRLDELAGPLPAEVRANRLAELDDILRWLPQLAGDTDLRRADWDEANRLTSRLVALRSAHKADTPLAESIVHEARPLTARLAELAMKGTSAPASASIPAADSAPGPVAEAIPSQ